MKRPLLTFVVATFNQEDYVREAITSLIHEGVIGDYRTPDRLRLGPTPITTRYADIWDAMDATRRILAGKDYEDFPAEPAQVT